MRLFKKGQMDLCVRYWDVNKSWTATRYFDSSFLGHATASDLQSSFTSSLKDQILSKIIQVSMDGPNFNLKVLDQLINQSEIQLEKSLLDMGSSGLHVVHGAFQNGHKNAKWNVSTALRSFYKLFHDSPVRRTDYQKINYSSVFPIKFCTTRWVENVKPAQRALDIYENIQKYVQNSKLPNNVTVNSVKVSVDDILMPVRVSFFSICCFNHRAFSEVFSIW